MSNKPAQSEATPTWYLRPWVVAALCCYALLMVAIVVGMYRMRDVTLATMGTSQAYEEWQEWRESEPNQSEDYPVRRRPPRSSEPPSLVLMRDHFAVVLGAAILFPSLLYVAMLVAVKGVAWRDSKTR